MIVFGFIINGLILAILLMIIAKEDIQNDYTKPIAIIIFSGLASFLVSLIIPGLIGSLLGTVAYLAVFYVLLGKFYIMDDTTRRKIVSIFFGIHIAWTVVAIALSAAS